jgi:tRNA/rRNA methyltransferase
VSFPLRSVIELVPKDEPPEASAARAERRAWLAERDYKVIGIAEAEAETDIGRILDRLPAAFSKC